MRDILSFLYSGNGKIVFFVALLLLIILTLTGVLSASTTPQIASGWDHSIALKSDGTVWAWGQNGSGQLGDRTTENKNTPVQVSGIEDATAIAGGLNQCLALKIDGTVLAWGGNSNGQLGDGTTEDKNIPVQVSGLSSVTAIACGNQHNLALKSDGTVWAWGSNSYGQLAIGTSTSSINYTPTQINSLNDVVFISCGGQHSLAVKSDGTLWAWGSNYSNQIGGDNYIENTPVQVNSLNDIIAAAGGAHHSLALKSDGTVWAWGMNDSGQLGDGSAVTRYTPVKVKRLNSIMTIYSKSIHSLALTSDGEVWAWGSNYYGQLGKVITQSDWTPVSLVSLDNVTAIACGGNHSLALESDGTVWACGLNSNGQLGDGTTTNRTTPVQVINLRLNSSATTSSATNLTPNSATLNGSVNANELSTTAWFEYGTTTGIYSFSTTTVTVSGMSDTTVSKEVNGLSSGTTYYYRIVAQNSEGTKYGSEMSFTTISPPTAATGAATNVTASSATMNGTVNAQGTATTAWFDYGTVQGSYGNKTAQRNVSGSSDTSISIGISGLSSNTTYYYCIAASNSAGTSYGSEYSFTTIFPDTTTSTSSTSTTSTTASTTSTTMQSTTTSSTTSTTTSSTTTTTLPTLPTPTLPPPLAPVASPSPVPTLPPLPTPKASPSPVHEGIVFGIVYDESDNPLADVTVTITGNNVYKDTTTDNDGYYEFTGLAAGSYTLEYEMEGYKDQSQEIRLKAGDTMEVEAVTMEAVVIGTIYGYVVNIQGNPIEDARVRLKGVRTKVSKSTASDADGFFEFKELEADTYLLFAKKERFKKTKVTVRLKDWEDKEVEIEMKKTTKRLKSMFVK